MTSLITGGAGLMGAEVVRLLLKQGEKPVVFSRNPKTPRLADVADEVEGIAGDLGNFSNVLDAVKTTRPDVIYHMGGMLTSPSDADPAASIQANALGTFHVLEAARLFDVRQVLFTSSLAVYGADIAEDFIDDNTVQHPLLFYGATKVFAENMGRFYKRKYGIDFRGVRYPSIIGPGMTTPGVAQYNPGVIEQSAKGNPFTIWVTPETRLPIMYFTESARSLVELGQAPVENIKTINYVLTGITPTPSAGELADAVRAKIPGAQITFEPDPVIQPILDDFNKRVDDTKSQEEWGWKPEFDLDQSVDEFLKELASNPERYA